LDKGFAKKYGVYYEETFTATAKIYTIKLILSLLVAQG